MPPLYDSEAVEPLRDELTYVGFRSLADDAEVDRAMAEAEHGTALIVVNSVCGCAAGSCRPGVMHALQNERIPDHLLTVFAGVDTEATDRVRDRLAGMEPSSPSVFLLNKGSVVLGLGRHDIEGMSAQEVADTLRTAFDKECLARGPSIPRETFEGILPVEECGSAIPPYQGN